MIKNNNILIIAPHPDDDVIGAGGRIAIAEKNGVIVKILYVTSGSGTIKTTPYKKLNRDAISKLRMNEAIKSINTLCGKGHKVKQHFMNLESSTLLKNPKTYTNALLKELKKEQYSQIYIPFTEDRHPTHSAVACLSFAVFRSFIKDRSLEVYAYETWDALPVVERTMFIDISKVYKKKFAAINVHKSQCAITPYADGILAKNRYNAVFKDINAKNKVEYAEIFIKVN